MLQNDPIIVVGMGGSGTRLIVRVFEECGVFFGAQLAQNNVAELEILNVIKAFTDEFRYSVPLPNDWESAVFAKRSEFLYFCRVGLPKAFQEAGYTGGLWGLKDPRNAFTARVFIDEFPDARILHVVRDPIDVAASKIRQKFHYLPSDLTMEYWLQVWLQNDHVANSYKSWLGERYFLLRYEDVCLGQDNAINTFSALANCNFDIAKRAVSKHAQTDRIGKARSYNPPQLSNELIKRRFEYRYPAIPSSSAERTKTVRSAGSKISKFFFR
jgi:hypothetical protein